MAGVCGIYMYVQVCVQTPCWCRLLELHNPCDDRRQQLEESLKLQHFFHDCEDELHWIKEHRPLADSDDHGKSLQEVQNLQKKHQVCAKKARHGLHSNAVLLNLPSLLSAPDPSE